MTENQNQPNIDNHSNSEFEAIINLAVKSGGLSLTAMKGWGKTRFLFSMANHLQQQPQTRVLIFDPSDAWLYGYSKIPTCNICEGDITLSEVKTSQDLEVFSFNNWKLVELALNSHKDLLFRLKSKSPSKRGYAIRQIINWLDDKQRLEKEQSPIHENKFRIAYFIEEFEDCFNNRLTARLEAETFLSLFNEARNFNESFFTCQQYEQDSAKTLRVKQISALGKLSESQKMPYHRKLERLYNINLSDMQPKTWLIEGKMITAPDWKQQLKPYIINRQLRAKFSQPQQNEKYPNIIKASLIAFCGLTQWYRKRHPNLYQNQTETSETETETEEPQDNEDSQGDGLMTLDDKDILFPEEF